MRLFKVVKCNGYETVLKLFCNCSSLFSSLLYSFSLSSLTGGGEERRRKKLERSINASAVLDKVVA